MKEKGEMRFDPPTPSNISVTVISFSKALHEVGVNKVKNSGMAESLKKKIFIRGLRRIKCQKLGFLDIFFKTDHQKFLILDPGFT